MMSMSYRWLCLAATCMSATSAAQLGAFTSGVRQVWHGDRVLLDESRAQESREYNVPMRSRSSPFLAQRGHSDAMVAVAVLQLAERGRMDLDTGVEAYLDAADYAAFGLSAGEQWCPAQRGSDACLTITARHLLSMTAGLIDASECSYPGGAWELAFCSGDRLGASPDGRSLAATISTFIRNPLASQPGSSFGYAHEGTVLLAYIVEKLTETPLSEYLHREVFLKVGMDSTFFDAGTRQLSLFKEPASYVEYYDVESRDSDPRMIAEGSCAAMEAGLSRRSAGSLISTVPDMVRFYTSLFVARNASDVLSDASLHAMISPHSALPESQCLLALGGSQHRCSFGLGVKLVYSAAAPSELVAFGSDSPRGSGCFWSTVAVFDDSTAPTHPVVAAAFTNNREVFVESAQWRAAMEGRASVSDCVACAAAAPPAPFAQAMARHYSSIEDNEASGYHGESDDIGEADMSVGMVVTVVLVPVFIITTMWLLVVTDFHRKKIFRTPVEQAERLRRIQERLRAEGKPVPDELSAAEAAVQNPMATGRGSA